MLADELRKIVKGEVLDDEATLTKFSHDASIFEVRPEVVVAPNDAEDIKALVNFVNEQREKNNRAISITARSAGTCMSGGPLSESIVLDMTKHFNKILEVDPSSAKASEGEVEHYAVVEPGVFYRDFDAETKRRSLFMPAYPASRELATVGGMVANNSGGEKNIAYGKTINFVMELNVVLSDGKEYVIKPISKKDLAIKSKLKGLDGKIYRKISKLLDDNADVVAKAKPNVPKNSAGYYLWEVYNPKTSIGRGAGKGVFDLTKLIVGSQGTLGIITKIKFKLVPVKPISKMIVIFLKDLKPIGDLVVELMKNKPESLEAYDDNTLKLAIKFSFALLKRMHKNIFSAALEFLPDLKMFIGGLPKLVVLAEFTGDKEAEVDARLNAAAEGLKKFPVKFRIVKSAEEAKKYWTIRRESFSLLREKVKDKHTAPFIDDFCVRPNQLSEFLPKLQEVLAKYPSIQYTIAGHVGDGNFHIIPLMNLENQEERMIIPKLSEEVYSLVLEYKGSITAEHNDGLIRSPYIEKMFGTEVYGLFKEVKEIFDPLTVFNPGKKVNPDMGYAMAHIRKNFESGVSSAVSAAPLTKEITIETMESDIKAIDGGEIDPKKRS